MSNARRTDLPTIEDESRAYWDAAREGRFVLRSCSDCGLAHHYPRPFCPECWSDNVEWIDATGRATLYTWSIVHVNPLPPFNERLPYVAAVVELEEGPKMMTNVIDCDPGSLEVGMALVVDFKTLTDEIMAPVFRPA
jgi:uncharacterized OB-fold protein